MWDHTTDRMFLDMREDSVLLFEQDTLTLLYCNPAAKHLLGDLTPGAGYTEIFRSPAIENLLQITAESGRPIVQTVPNTPWNNNSAAIHTLLLEWEGVPAVAITIDAREYGLPSQAVRMMKAVLTSAYFTAVRINLATQQASVISDKNPLMSTQASFPSFLEYVQRYAEALIHPEDRAQFLAAFTLEQLHLFLEANTLPTVTVRRLTDEEYRWASFTLTAVDANLIMLFGQDSNEQHLQEERSEQMRSELESVSMRNTYILSSISDIFRLMLHIDLETGDTVICSMHPDLEHVFSYDLIYPFEEVSSVLMSLVYPEDRKPILPFSSIERLRQMAESTEHNASFEYRRISPHLDPSISSRWTRSIINILPRRSDSAAPEAIYTVQDIDEERRRELSAKREQDSLLAQFNTLIKNRFLWFIEADFSTQIARCHRIANHNILPAMECPFGQFFERMIMPHVHPEDFKKVAKMLLPASIEALYKAGTEQTELEYRVRHENGWCYVRAEIYLRRDDAGILHAMIYVADIDEEVRRMDSLTREEHEQLSLRRKFGMMIEDSFVRVDEVDIDADCVCHYHIENQHFCAEPIPQPFSEFWAQFPTRFIHPQQRDQFLRIFSYQQVLRAAREHREQIKQLFLFDARETQQYEWCNVAVRFFHDENGKAYLMCYVENVNEEICQRDNQLHALREAQQQLRDHMRDQERQRIRKAHMFINIASNFQLALNQIYDTLDKLEHNLPEDSPERQGFRSMFTSYERLSAMTEAAKDVLLLENNQLQLLREPVQLPLLIRKMRENSANVYHEKHLRLVSYSTHVTQETLLTDSRRLYYLIDNIFINMLRSLPAESEVSMQLSQNLIPGEQNKAMYEFSLVTHGDSVSQDIQSGMLSPIPAEDPLRSMEEVFLLDNSNYQQHSLYLSKRLIALMGGTIGFTRLPHNASAITLRIPFEFIPKQVLFPVRFFFRKRVCVWDSVQPAAMATMEMLRETGMNSEWQADFENLCAYLKMSAKQQQPYDLLILRQTDVNKQGRGCIAAVEQLAPETPIIVLLDTPADDPSSSPYVRYVRTPLFRSMLAEQLWDIVDKSNPEV